MSIIVEIPDPAEQIIRELRRENAKYRRKYRETRAELVELVTVLDKHRVNDQSWWDAFNFHRPNVLVPSKK